MDNNRPRQITVAERIEDPSNGGNLPPRARFYAVMHINGPRRRRGTIFPITAADGVPAFRRMLSTFSRFASATQRSNPPLVWASVKRILRPSFVFFQSTTTVVSKRF